MFETVTQSHPRRPNKYAKRAAERDEFISCTEIEKRNQV